MKQLVLQAAKAAGLFAASRFVFRSQLRILCYHGIWAGDAPHYGDCLFMRAATFAQRMAWLAQSGCTVLPLDEALRRLQDGTLPRWAVAITIDDAWYGTYRYMLPVLEQHGLPATVYVTTFYPGKDAPVLNIMVHGCVERCADLPRALAALARALPELALDDAPSRDALATRLVRHVESGDGFEQKALRAWTIVEALGVDRTRIEDTRCFHMMNPSELADAHRRGFDLQPHTHRHKMYGFDPEQLGADLALNRQLISAFSGRPAEQLLHFCYPSGSHAAAAVPTLQASGMQSATTTEFGLARTDSPPYALPRILDCECLSPLEFEAKVTGFWSLLKKRR